MALALALLGLGALVSLSQPTELPRPRAVEVSDRPEPREVPVYTQTDERWSGLPYADADVGTSGCGLTAAAMAWTYLSGEEWTPPRLLNEVGNDYVQDGQNYMPGFAEWMAERDPAVGHSVIYESRERVLSDLADGHLAFAAMSGPLVPGGREYGGHIVLLTGMDGSAVMVNDPCTVYGLELTPAMFDSVDWAYFITIGRGYDGSQRD